jgi:hypothetical protein
MADVLIVCVREDEPLAKAFADMFERAGLHVGGAPGAPDDMRSCGAALVVWSQASIRSRAFLDAAQRAVNAGKAVVACLIAPPPPASINHAPAFDLSQWAGDPDDPVLDPLFFAVDRMVAAARAAAGVATPVGAVARGAVEPQTSYFPPPPAPAAAPPYARARPSAAPAAPARTPGASRAAPSFEHSPRAMPVRRPAAPEPMRDPDQTAAEAQNWAAIRHSRNPEDFLRHLADYGSEGAFAELAQMKLAELEAEARRRKQTPAAAARQDGAQRPSVRLEPTRPVLPRQEPVRPEPPQMRSVRPPSFEPIQGEAQRPRPQPAPRPPVRREAPPAWRDEMRGEPMRRPTAPPRQSSGALRLVAIVAVLGASALGAGLFMGNRMGNGGGSDSQSQAANDSWDNNSPSGASEGRTVAERDMGVGALESQSSQRTAVEGDDLETAGGPTRLEREPAAMPRSVPERRETREPREREVRETTPAPTLTIRDRQPTLTSTTTTAGPATPTSAAPLSLQPSITAPATQPPPAPVQVASAEPPRTQPAAARPFVIWASRPSMQRLAEYFPQRALRTGQGGRVELDCLIDTGGVPRCAVARETPPGFGFGSAAVRASSQFRASPTLNDGSASIGAQTRLVISFPSPSQ